MKKIFLVFVLILSASFLKAQDAKTKPPFATLSLGPEFSLPGGLFGEVYSSGIGASAQANFALASNVAFTINTAYNNYFLTKTYGGGSEGFVPLLGGFEIAFSPVIYSSAQLGLTFYTQQPGSAFTYSPGIGFRISKNFTALLKYIGKIKSAINSGAIGVRVAYTFGK